MIFYESSPWQVTKCSQSQWFDSQAPRHQGTQGRRDGDGQRTTCDGAAWQNMWGGRMQSMKIMKKAWVTGDPGELMLIMNSNQVWYIPMYYSHKKVKNGNGTCIQWLCVVFNEPKSPEMRCESRWIQFSSMVHIQLLTCARKTGPISVRPFWFLGVGLTH